MSPVTGTVFTNTDASTVTVSAFVWPLWWVYFHRSAETAGRLLADPNPDGMPYLLARAVWDEDMCAMTCATTWSSHLGDPQGVLVVDETGDLKKAP